MLDHFLGKHLKEMKKKHESLSEKKLNDLIMASKEIMKGNEYSDPLNELVEKLRQFEEELGIAL